MAEFKPSKITEKEKSDQSQKSGPSGATTKHEERENKFDEEGGAQPQAASQRESDQALKAAQVVQGNRNSTAASAPSTASQWDRSKSKPRGAEHDDRNEVPVGGQHNQQSPQLKDRK